MTQQCWYVVLRAIQSGEHSSSNESNLFSPSQKTLSEHTPSNQPTKITMGNLVLLMIAIFGFQNMYLCMPGNISNDNLYSERCWSSSNDVFIGVCVPSLADCHYRNGIPVQALCSIESETCCIIIPRIYNCEVETDGGDTYISSPGYPGPLEEQGTCAVLIKKDPFENRQLRIDFLDFNMISPSNGICDNDNMTIADITVCGQIHNQHLYLGLGDHTDFAIMKFSTSSSNYNRAWRIKLSKELYTEQKPSGCTQYSPHTTGTIHMFNQSLHGPLLENKQGFKICIKRAKNVCSIVFEPCEQLDEPFKIEKPLLFSDDMTLIKLGMFIHSALPKDIRGGCVRYEQKYCSDLL